MLDGISTFTFLQSLGWKEKNQLTTSSDWLSRVCEGKGIQILSPPSQVAMQGALAIIPKS